MTVAWSPDGKRIVSSADDSTVQVWNATDGSHIYFLNVMLVLAISAVGGAFIYLFKHYMRILAHVPMLVYELTFYVASLSSALIGWWLPVPMHQSLALLACVLFAGALAFSVGYRRELAHVFIIVMILFLVWTPMAMLFTSPFISFFAIGALLAALGWNDFVLWAINELGAHVRSGFSQQIEHATLAGFVVLTLFLCLIHPTKHASVPDKYSCI